MFSNSIYSMYAGRTMAVHGRTQPHTALHSLHAYLNHPPNSIAQRSRSSVFYKTQKTCEIAVLLDRIPAIYCAVKHPNNTSKQRPTNAPSIASPMSCATLATTQPPRLSPRMKVLHAVPSTFIGRSLTIPTNWGGGGRRGREGGREEGEKEGEEGEKRERREKRGGKGWV